MPGSVIEMFDIPEVLEPSFVDLLSDDELFGIKGTIVTTIGKHVFCK